MNAYEEFREIPFHIAALLRDLDARGRCATIDRTETRVQAVRSAILKR